MLNLFLTLISCLLASTTPPYFEVETLTKNQGVIWSMAFVDSDHILFSVRSGQFKKIALSTGKVTDIKGAPSVFEKGQGGLLGLLLDKDFQKNKKIYFSYAKEQAGKASTALASAVLKESELVDVREIFVAKPAVSGGVHFGGRLAQDNQGHLYLSVGERGERDFAQKLDSHHGKIIRLMSDGSIPKDNPFINRAGALPEIFSFGQRNPQGLFFDGEKNILWESEHGPRGGDEINIIKAGANYGWPVVTYGKEYWGPKIGEGSEKEGIESPLYQFTPSIAPSGLLLYKGSAFKNWKGNLFSGSLVLTHLNRLVLEGGKIVKEERLLENLVERFREVIEGPDGLIYLSTDNGMILRLRPKG
jgi:glucose/arabinose dehydrogenase